jgi:hypothetical protein
MTEQFKNLAELEKVHIMRVYNSMMAVSEFVRWLNNHEKETLWSESLYNEVLNLTQRGFFRHAAETIVNERLQVTTQSLKMIHAKWLITQIDKKSG